VILGSAKWRHGANNEKNALNFYRRIHWEIGRKSLSAQYWALFQGRVKFQISSEKYAQSCVCEHTPGYNTTMGPSPFGQISPPPSHPDKTSTQTGKGGKGGRGEITRHMFTGMEKAADSTQGRRNEIFEWTIGSTETKKLAKQPQREKSGLEKN